MVSFCTITIVLSSLYSRAWSYDGFGININIKFILVFNLLVIAGSIFAYFIPSVISLSLKIVGSIFGVLGVMVCTAEILWLKKSDFLNKPFIFKKIRALDIVSFVIGVIFVILYWATNGIWIINDILAVCTIVAGIKILKIRSLKIGIIMLFSLLFFEIIAGLIVHYVIGISYNNLIIELFESPLVVVFPSITY